MTLSLARMPAIAALVVLGLGLCSASPASAAARGPDCAAGETALRAGRPQQAAEIFAGIRPQRAACVVRGRTAAAALLRAERMIALGMRSAADEQIKRALEAEPDLTVPEDLRPNTVGQAGIRLAKALDREGYHSAARDVLRRVIESDPDIRLDGDTQRILGKAGHPWHWWLTAPFTSPVTWALAPWILVAFVVGTLAYGNIRKRLYFQPFSGIGQEADQQAAALRALIRAELHRLAKETAELPDGRRLRLDQAGPYEDQIKHLEAVTDGLPQGRFVGAALSLLLRKLPARSRLVTGTLLATPGVVLGIEKPGGELEHTEAIHRRSLDFPAPDSGRDGGTTWDGQSALALAAAVWIVLSRHPNVTLGGTRRWDSYLSFAAGCAWQAQGRLDRARVLYTRACDDPANKAAAINLAALDRLGEPGTDPRTSASYERLTRLLADSGREDLHHYRARYLLSFGLRDAVEGVRRPPPTGSGLAGSTDAPGAVYAPEADATRAETPRAETPRAETPLVETPEAPRGVRAALRAEARRQAVELALELEEARRNPTLPAHFVEQNRAAALTLLARQVFPETSSSADILKMSPIKEFTDTAIGPELAQLRDGGPVAGTAESLVKFVEVNCVLDEQAHFNLYRYHALRATNLATTIEYWQDLLDDVWDAHDGDGLPPEVDDWAQAVQVWQDSLEERYQTELHRVRDHESQLLAAEDALMADRVRSTTVSYRPAPAPGRSHHPAYGTEYQLPPLTQPPPPEPPRVEPPRPVPARAEPPPEPDDPAWSQPPERLPERIDGADSR